MTTKEIKVARFISKLKKINQDIIFPMEIEVAYNHQELGFGESHWLIKTQAQAIAAVKYAIRARWESLEQRLEAGEFKKE